MATTAQYLNKLIEQKNTLADNLVTKGVAATHVETLETLVPKVLNIKSGGGSGISPIDETGLPTGDVIVPEGVTNLKASVFSNNKNITSVSLPDNLIALDGSSFSGCTKLQTINIPNTMSMINSSTFYNCSELKTVNLPNAIVRISSSAFYNCLKLANLMIGEEALYQLDNSAFNKDIALTNTDVENILKHVDPDKALGNLVFQNCTGLTNLTIKYAGDSMFRGCTNLTYVKILSTLSNKEIPSSIFYNECPKLETCYLPDGATKIGVTVFYKCISLKTVYLPSSITTAVNNSLLRNNYYIFNGCTALEDVQLGQDWNMSLDLSVSNNITVDSMVAMFNNLKDLTEETAKTFTLGETNLAKLSDEQKAIATNKNWTLA